MSYTIAQIITKVRELLNEELGAFWTDTELTGWIQEATIDLSSKLLCVADTGTITLVQDQYVYSSTDESWIGSCLKPKSMWYDSSSGPISMQMIRIQQFGHTDAFDSEPKYYHYENAQRRFYILPVPDSSVAGDTVSVVNVYETDDATLLKDEYQPLVFLYVVYKAKLKERLYQEASYAYQQYALNLKFEKQDKYELGLEPTSEFIVPS